MPVGTSQKKIRTSKPKKEIISKEKKEKINKAVEIAVYYGFTPKKFPDITKADIDAVKDLNSDEVLGTEESSSLKKHSSAEEKSAILREYNQSWASMPQPAMVALYHPQNSSSSKNWKKIYCDLEIIGTPRSVAEALLIKTSVAIMKEAKYENISVEINSLGDKESIGKFTRDLSNYYRKNIEDICNNCRQQLKDGPFQPLSCEKSFCKEIAKDAPKSMAFLSDQSRAQFMEILEFLEKNQIEFKMNEHLIGNIKFCQETVFEIVSNEGSKREVLALGMRYNSLAKKIGMKREIPAVGVSILAEIKPENPVNKVTNKPVQPFAYFMQLGFEAKLESLKIIEDLRREKIYIHHNLTRDKIGGQLTVAEKMHIPYSIIMGKKEFLEKSVVVREMSSYTQESVKLDNLAHFMKNLSVKWQKRNKRN